MNFKKIFCCMLVLLAIIALAACGTKEDKYFTVVFDADGGSDVLSQTIIEGGTSSAPAQPTKNGYTFAGWYLGDTAWDFATAITADTSLKAKWEATQYTITYLEYNAETGASTPITLSPATYTIENDDFVLPAPTKEHYNFMGWYLDTACTQNIQSVTKGSYGNITVYAQYTERNYGITYVLDGGVNNDNNLPSYNVTSTFPITLGEPTKAGFDFLGWYADANYTTPVTAITAPSGDVTVYAKWQASAPVNSYTITYMDGTTPITGLNPTFYLEGSSALLPTPAKPQHDFFGWYTDASFTDGTKLDGITPATTGNLTLYAKFVPNGAPAPSYTITYMDGTTPLTGLTPETYTLGTALVLPHEINKQHYRFDGWYTDAGFAEGTKMEVITVATSGNLVLYAKFTPVTYTITYALAGGDNHPGNAALTEYTILSTDTLGNPTKDGHTFAGWYTDPYFRNKITSLTGQSGNLVLYAKWIQISGSGILTPVHPF